MKNFDIKVGGGELALNIKKSIYQWPLNIRPFSWDPIPP